MAHPELSQSQDAKRSVGRRHQFRTAAGIFVDARLAFCGAARHQHGRVCLPELGRSSARLRLLQAIQATEQPLTEATNEKASSEEEA